MKKLLTLGLLLIMFFGCSNPKSENTKMSPSKLEAKYEIISEVKSETSYKAQLIEYSIYKDTIFNRHVLGDIVKEIYQANKDKNIFENHENATVIAVYLFTSKDSFKDKSDWIAMLLMGPNKTEPSITYNEFKLTALSKLNDNVKSDDEIELEKLKSYLQKKGLDLCELSIKLKQIELDNIHKADKKYPDYGDGHMKMIEKLDAQSYNMLKKKYKLDEDMLSKVSVFAMSYCK